MIDFSEKPSHHNLPVVSNPILIFEVVVAFIIQDIEPKPLNSSQIGSILNLSVSPIPSITRFLNEIGVISTKRSGNYWNYLLTKEGEELAHEIINQNNNAIHAKLGKLLPNYYVVQIILSYIQDNPPRSLEEILGEVSKILGIYDNMEYKKAVSTIFDLLLNSNLIYNSSDNKIMIGSRPNGRKTPTMTFENIYSDILAREKKLINKKFVPDEENDFYKRIHHHHLTRVTDPSKIFEILTIFINENNRPLRTNDVALRLKHSPHSPSGTIKSIRFLGAMRLLVKGRIENTQFYKLTADGEFVATELMNENYDNAYSKLAELLPKYYVVDEILNYIQDKGLPSLDDLYSEISEMLEIAGNKEYINGLKTLMKIMSKAGIIHIDSKNKVLINSSTKESIFFPSIEGKPLPTVKRRIKLSILQVNRIFGSTTIEEDVFSIINNIFTESELKVAPIKGQPQMFLTLKLDKGRDQDHLIGELAVVKKDDLPGAVSISTLDVRGLELEDDEGIYIPTHFILKKQGRYAIISSESYRLGPTIASLSTILECLLPTNRFNFKHNYLVDRANIQGIDRFERIISLEVRVATQHWDKAFAEMSPLEGLDDIIVEAKNNFGEIFVSIRYSAKRNENLGRIKDSLNSLKNWFLLGRKKKAIRKALIEGKTESGDGGYIDLLYDKVVVSEDVYVDQNDTRMVDKDSIYGALYRNIDHNEDFIARTMPHEEMEEE